jgi:hypothetical protein
MPKMTQDLLSQTVRKYCFIDAKAPAWWLPCYDLRTEFHLFAAEHKHRAAATLTNRWIIKPAQGSRAIGHRVISNPSSSGLHDAAICTSSFLPDEVAQAMVGVGSEEELRAVLGDTKEIPSFDGMDRVAQLFAEHPLLINGRKFDMRFFVLVKSFYPLDGEPSPAVYAI